MALMRRDLEENYAMGTRVRANQCLHMAVCLVHSTSLLIIPSQEAKIGKKLRITCRADKVGRGGYSEYLESLMSDRSLTDVVCLRGQTPASHCPQHLWYASFQRRHKPAL